MRATTIPPAGGGRDRLAGNWWQRTGYGGGIMYADPLPYTGGRTGTGGSPSTGGRFITDGGSPPIIGGSQNTGGVAGYAGSSTGGKTAGIGGLGIGGMVVDMVPQSGGTNTGGQSVSTGGMGIGGGSLSLNGGHNSSEAAMTCIVDPAPPGPHWVAQGHDPSVVENWRDTSPRHVTRSTDIALFDPPVISLKGEAKGPVINVTLNCDETNLSLRWECEGNVQGEGRQVKWRPASDDDALCVAARGPGGIAVASLRARDVLRPRDS